MLYEFKYHLLPLVGVVLSINNLKLDVFFCIDKSINDIKKILDPLVIPPTKDDDPDFYLDYGSDTSYHTKTGKGECAAWLHL